MYRNPNDLIIVAQYFQGVFEEEVEQSRPDDTHSAERRTMAYCAWKAAEKLLAEMAGVK